MILRYSQELQLYFFSLFVCVMKIRSAEKELRKINKRSWPQNTDKRTYELIEQLKTFIPFLGGFFIYNVLFPFIGLNHLHS